MEKPTKEELKALIIEYAGAGIEASKLNCDGDQWDYEIFTQRALELCGRINTALDDLYEEMPNDAR